MCVHQAPDSVEQPDLLVRIVDAAVEEEIGTHAEVSTSATVPCARSSAPKIRQMIMNLVRPLEYCSRAQTTLAHGTVARRVETLRRVNRISSSTARSTFGRAYRAVDDVFRCLMEHIETSAKALLANRLAPVDAAPHRRSARWRSTT